MRAWKRYALKIVRPGTNWYSVKKQLFFIIDDVRYINFYLRPVDTNKEYIEKIDISSLPFREGKMTRIEMDVILCLMRNVMC